MKSWAVCLLLGCAAAVNSHVRLSNQTQAIQPSNALQPQDNEGEIQSGGMMSETCKDNNKVILALLGPMLEGTGITIDCTLIKLWGLCPSIPMITRLCAASCDHPCVGAKGYGNDEGAAHDTAARLNAAAAEASGGAELCSPTQGKQSPSCGCGKTLAYVGSKEKLCGATPDTGVVGSDPAGFWKVICKATCATTDYGAKTADKPDDKAVAAGAGHDLPALSDPKLWQDVKAKVLEAKEKHGVPPPKTEDKKTEEKKTEEKTQEGNSKTEPNK